MSTFYYLISLLKSPLEPLTYESDLEIEIGAVVEVALKNRKELSLGVVIKKVMQPSFKCVEITHITNRYYTQQTIHIGEFIAKYYVCSIGEALGLFIPFIKQERKSDQNNNFTSEIQLSQKQKEAYNFTKEHKRSLLFANTGSGKTEIYIKAIEDALNQNKNSVYLLPEIALTPQMEQRLLKVFGSRVAIWHSKITQKKKNEILDKLASNEVKIIAGARSALFLPYPNLGLIIVDEEHDDSYKSEQKPRLHVRDLALYISQKYNIQVILGSATPSLNSFSKVPYFRLKETFYKTEKSFIYDNSNLKLNQLLIEKIDKKLKQNEQTIIFLPTRANFKYQICSDCGKALECPFCSVALSLHKNHKALKCHYCNYTQQIIDICPSCKTGILKNYRLGTNELQEQLLEVFPDKSIATFDRDSVKNETSLKKILKEFNQNKIDILIGTQMLSKGHDYHNVTLAIILGIDSVLNMTSYKAKEKALSLALQIAGRSGRNGKGEVIIQTKNQDFFETYMEQSDYNDFLENELVERGEIYPPNIRLARVIFSHTNHQKAKELMELYVNQIIRFHQEIELVGFKECEIFKIANRYRYEILVRGKDVKKILEFLHSIDSPYATIDMDTLV